MSSRYRGSGARASTIAAVAITAVLLVASPAIAQLQCVQTTNDCDTTATVTSSSIQIGGMGSRSSDGPADPARLTDGTIAEGRYDFTYDKSTGILTLVVPNTTTTKDVLSGIFFNFPPQVTGMTLLSYTGTLPWVLNYDLDRGDGVVDTAPWRTWIWGSGFGVYNVFISNSGTADPDKDAGWPDREILAGDSLTFTIQVAGDISHLSACSFTSMPSLIPPGDKTQIALARFQAGVSGGSAVIGPCQGGDLLISLAQFDAEPDAGKVTLKWDTASEIDNAGFAIIRRNPRNQTVERLNSTLIPGLGSRVSGSSYVYVDNTAIDGVKYIYQLEDFDLNGDNTLHSPKAAIPNPHNAKVKLLAPAYEAKAGHVVKFEWQVQGRERGLLEISADPKFPKGSTLRIQSGARSSRTLTAREMDQVRAMAGSSVENGVYWRVTGLGNRGTRDGSETFFLMVE